MTKECSKFLFYYKKNYRKGNHKQNPNHDPLKHSSRSQIWQEFELRIYSEEKNWKFVKKLGNFEKDWKFEKKIFEKFGNLENLLKFGN